MVEATQVTSSTTLTVLRPYNRFTIETDSENMAPFLDVLVIINGLALTLGKPTDTGRYLNFESIIHPMGQFRSYAAKL
jgi:hypothetical protein